LCFWTVAFVRSWRSINLCQQTSFFQVILRRIVAAWLKVTLTIERWSRNNVLGPAIQRKVTLRWMQPFLWALLHFMAHLLSSQSVGSSGRHKIWYCWLESNGQGSW
jgi:hypothetical protein